MLHLFPSFSPLFTLPPTMVNKGDAFQQGHEINKAIVELQAPVKKLSTQIA